MAVEWFSSEAVDSVQGTLEGSMERICQFLEGEVIRSLSEGQPPSKPGKPPHVLTGELKTTIGHSVETKGSKVIGRVGSDFPGAARLELGFMGKDREGRNVHQPPRPFLRPAIYKHKAEIREILANPEIKLSVKTRRRVRTSGRVRQTRGRV